MLTIRAVQKEILAKASFEAWMVDHARQFFAAECEALDTDGTLAFIRKTIARARRHGLTDGPDICTYVDLAFTFGEDFDTRCPWAESILSAAAGHASEITMDRLYASAMAVLDPEAARAAEAARRAEDGDEDDVGNETEPTEPSAIGDTTRRGNG